MAQDDPKVKMIIVLTSIMIVSAAVLTGIFVFTKPKIEAHKVQAKKEAILEVLPGSEEYKTVNKNGLELYKGYDENGNLVGTAIQTEGSGFQSVIKLMLGLDLENDKILAVKVLSHKETPGLGARMTEPWFQDQFKEKEFSDEFKAKEDVEAIAGSTISSQSVADIIENTIEKVESATEGGGE
ncbi:RnfABCDGE type electron transport complex subunit G [Acetohalobium arabaticum]|uniref:Ion-translocating oxidoreductase complex subunit G n=1 Tax=Acetohalobium arabaticum (strain ATCC 49924 / DSM 5501 / Z-7288) TaxID=574087 RepID=D9QV19_ACEAZ|nr:RnfABCDGE type electron transport complex subunit G [Acetohalobium arabaticum]ADL12078.1 electron transport complex, RnfABCDGE type, G subunit [Acetohalobium arabaticum DSM 5501]